MTNPGNPRKPVDSEARGERDPTAADSTLPTLREADAEPAGSETGAVEAGEVRDATVEPPAPEADTGQSVERTLVEEPSAIPEPDDGTMDQWESGIPPLRPSLVDQQTGKSAPGITSPGARLRGETTRLPEHIAGYETLGRLGEGAFGVVLKCRDTKLDRLVAIKLQKVNPLKAEQQVDRFLSEARAAGQLRHPHIVPVYEFGEFGGNQFIVYQFIDGQTLDRWLQSHPDLREQAAMMARIADALDYAHSLGIVHRDIKPANILVDHQYQQPHIADFGCARFEHPDSLQTVDGSLMGTPAYMSPEVCEGYANQADARADLWAMGVMLYETLVGHRPFRGRYAELFRQIRGVEPKRPRQIKPSVPAELETITLKCLEKDRERRYRRCGELARDLRNWLEDRPITARKVGLRERTWLWSKRNPAIATLTGIVATCLVLVAVSAVLVSVNTARKNAEILRGRDDLVASRLDSLESAAAEALPTIVEDLALDPAVLDRVRQRREQRERNLSERFPFDLAIYRLSRESGSHDADALDRLADYVRAGGPQRVPTLLSVAGRDLPNLKERFWNVAGDPARPSPVRLAAATILAAIDNADSRWSAQVVPSLEQLLVEEDSLRLMRWCRLLQPVADRFKPHVETLFFTADGDGNERDEASARQRAAEIASWLYEEDLPFLLSLGTRITPQGRVAMPRQLRQFGHVLANVPGDQLQRLLDSIPAVATDGQPAVLANRVILQWLGQPGSPTPAPGYHFPPPVRHRLINHCGPAGVDASLFTQRIRQACSQPSGDCFRDAGSLAGAVLTLGGYDLQQLLQTRRAAIKAWLLQLFCEHPDVAVHSACRWLLEQWGFEGDVASCRESLREVLPQPGFTWHEDPAGICFAVFDPVKSFHYGPDDSYPWPVLRSMTSQTVSIPRRFGIAVQETTREAFAAWETRMTGALRQQAELDPDRAAEYLELARQVETEQANRLSGESVRNESPASRAPVTAVSWDYVAWFCNSMNRQGGLATSDNVYAISHDGRWKAREIENALQQLHGYRLPTAAEWEYACRGTAGSRYFFGNSSELFEAYGWSVNNSHDRRQPVGLLKPNDHGLFDVHGNAAEWCHNPFEPEHEIRSSRLPREIRGQGVSEETEDITVFFRSERLPHEKSANLGFRLARTYPPGE
jgi:serine/threonine protein kinase/formylglycine-generating enzyme required for sulfatase activity